MIPWRRLAPKSYSIVSRTRTVPAGSTVMATS